MIEAAGVVVEPVECASGASTDSFSDAGARSLLLSFDWLTMASAGPDPMYRPVADVEGIVFLPLVFLATGPVVFWGFKCRGGCCRSGNSTAPCLISAGGDESCEMKRETEASPE